MRDLTVLCVHREGRDAVLERLRAVDDFSVSAASDPRAVLDRLDDADCVVGEFDIEPFDGVELSRWVASVHPSIPYVLVGDGDLDAPADTDGDSVDERVSFDGSDDEETLVETVRECSERHAEVAPSNDAAYYRALIGGSTDLFALLDGAGRFDYVSSSVERILGYTPSELRGERAFDYIHEDDVDDTLAAFEEVLETDDERIEAEYRFRDADGNWRVLESRGRNYLGTPPVDGIVINTRDVTQQRAQQETLEAIYETGRELFEANSAEQILGTVLSAVDDVVGYPLAAIWKRDGGVLSLEAITPESEVFVGEYLGGVDVEEIELGETGIVAKALADDETVVAEEFGSDVDLGADSPVEAIVARPLGDWGVLVTGTTSASGYSEREVSFIEILCRSATVALERIDHVETLREQNRRLDEFASVVSHDLRNPLSIAMAYTELAAEGDDEALENLEAALERMERLIDELLTLARQGEVITDTTHVDLDEVVWTAWRSVETETAELVLTEELGGFEADPKQLRRLVENLFTNAVEHGRSDDGLGGDGSPVTVRVGSTDGGFFVADDGSGISDADRERVFERGYSERDDGTGFGLSIVETIADAHDWEVIVGESRDGGARFDITDADPGTTASARQSASGGAFDG